MKPSEFFIKTRINNQRWYDSDDANELTITELDKRFIDREELKEKIHKNSKCLNIDTEYYDGYRQAIKDVLELIK